ncbi:MAG: hypothetical protein Kow00127_13180 [Bacteroidales bacterium]
MSQPVRRRRIIIWKRGYFAYRRFRYICYLNRKRKRNIRERLREEKLELKQASRIARQEMREQERIEKQRIRQEVRQAKEEAKLIRKREKERLKEERKAEKAKQKQERLEARQLAREAKEFARRKAREDKLLARQEKAERKRRLKVKKQKYKRLRPYIRKRRYRAFINNLKRYNLSRIAGWFRWAAGLSANPGERSLFYRIFFNSLVLFILSYVVIYLAGQWLTVWAATTFDYQVRVFPYKIYYEIKSEQWTADSVKILYSIIPLVFFILGGIFLIIYNSLKLTNSPLKVFFLWGFLHGMVALFGSILMGTLLNQGIGWVIAYMYYRDTGKMIFSILSIFILVITGGILARTFLISGNAWFNKVDSSNRRLLFTAQALMPALIGTVILALLKIPTNDYYITGEEYFYEVYKVATILLVLIPMGLSAGAVGELFFDEEPRKQKFIWWPVLLVLIVVALHLFLTWDGVLITG